MNNDHINKNQQAQEKPTRKSLAFKWLWRAIRLIDMICRAVEYFEGGE